MSALGILTVVYTVLCAFVFFAMNHVRIQVEKELRYYKKIVDKYRLESIDDSGKTLSEQNAEVERLQSELKQKEEKLKELSAKVAQTEAVVRTSSTTSGRDANKVLAQCYDEIAKLDEEIEKKKTELQSYTFENVVRLKTSEIENTYKGRIEDLTSQVEAQKRLIDKYNIRSVDEADRLLQQIKERRLAVEAEIEEKRKKLERVNEDYEQANQEYQDDVALKNQTRERLQKEIEEVNQKLVDDSKYYNEQTDKLRIKYENEEAKLTQQKEKLKDLKSLVDAIRNAVANYRTGSSDVSLFNGEKLKTLEDAVQEVSIYLNALNDKTLSREFKKKEKQIDELVRDYINAQKKESDKAFFRILGCAVKAELQCILVKLTYSKAEDSKMEMNTVVEKYRKLAVECNRAIEESLSSFFFQLEFLLDESIDIEHEYYIKREQAREEQKTIREQRRLYEYEQKKLREEEEHLKAEQEKYLAELERLRQKSQEATEEQKQVIDADIQKIESQMEEISEQKEQIVNLQHGKAGYVYILSNLGSFGDSVFKIGMTRRPDPQDRVDELGCASVPFEFDVHSFIFSNDAPALESELHRRLNEKRVNKVNLRKEFFSVDMDELEKLVMETYPSAEFNRTMLAQEYRDTISIEEKIKKGIPLESLMSDESLVEDDNEDEEDLLSSTNQ